MAQNGQNSGEGYALLAPALGALLARAGGAPDFAGLEQRLTRLQRQVRAVFVRLTGG